VNATLPAAASARHFHFRRLVARHERGAAAERRSPARPARRCVRDYLGPGAALWFEVPWVSAAHCGRTRTGSSRTFGSWWANTFWNGTHRFAPGERLLVPMDARTTAGPTGPADYAFYAVGGWSWSVPWIAGLYALACEAKPDLTPQEFWATALKTGRTVKVSLDKETAELGTIADPLALIQALKPGF